MTSTASWIEVDRAGLAQVIADKPKVWILFELIQNALDEDTTEIDVAVESVGRGLHQITVTDNSPDGYHDIKHAWTLYAPSKKKADPELRGRFNVGCKMVLALAKNAKIVSTKAAVSFGERGRELKRERREVGTQFTGVFSMTKQEAADACQDVMQLLPPDGVKIELWTPSGVQCLINREEPTRSFSVTALPTQFADDEGILRNTKRNCEVELYECSGDEVPMLYEMGIPVVELDGDDPYHVNVLQRVPLNTDRDNVTPSYLRTLRVAVLNNVHEDLDKDQAQAVWATEASEDERAEDDAVKTVLDQRFGKKRVAYDLSDPEANSRAMAAGYTVVSGGSMTSGQWRNAKSSGSILPAGQVTPSQKVRSAPDGVPALEGAKWTTAMQEVADWAKFLANALNVCDSTSVAWYGGREANLWKWAGAWSKGGSLSLNKPKLGHELRAWEAGNRRPMAKLLLHEFAHEEEDNHLSDNFAETGISLGVELAFLALGDEELNGMDTFGRD
jgi:hypothetical protein